MLRRCVFVVIDGEGKEVVLADGEHWCDAAFGVGDRLDLLGLRGARADLAGGLRFWTVVRQVPTPYTGMKYVLGSPGAGIA